MMPILHLNVFAARGKRSVARTAQGMRSVPLVERVRWAGKTAAIVGALCMAGWAFGERFEIRYDPQVLSCIDAEILLVDTKDRTPAVGKVYAYRSAHTAPVYPDGTAMAKFVAAGPGDTVEITHDFRVLVNGQEKARGLPHLSGIPADEVRRKFCGKRVLAQDEFWMLGTAPQSFDSRYWGPIRSAQIIGRAYVVF